MLEAVRIPFTISESTFVEPNGVSPNNQKIPEATRKSTPKNTKQKNRKMTTLSFGISLHSLIVSSWLRYNLFDHHCLAVTPALFFLTVTQVADEIFRVVDSFKHSSEIKAAPNSKLILYHSTLKTSEI